MAQLVARLSGGQEAVSSSLATPTNNKKDNKSYPFFVLFGVRETQNVGHIRTA